MAGQLVQFEVPIVSVNFEEADPLKDLIGRHKLTMLKYLLLDETIEGLGFQRFGKSTASNIPLKPVRDWVRSHWKEEFAYDMRKRSVPITFRTALALSLFRTRISEHLSELGGVEIYPSKDVAEAYKRHKLPPPVRFSNIDYASLPEELRGELTIPIVDNLYKAEKVARAKLLFPNGVDTRVLHMANPALIFGLLNHRGDRIDFDGIKDLNEQALAAETCTENYIKVREMETFVGRHKREPESRKPTGDKETFEKEGDYMETVDDTPDIHYEEGTTFFDVFPFKEGETIEELLQAFKRIAKTLFYHGRTSERHHGEYFFVNLGEDGKLVGFHGYTEHADPFIRYPPHDATKFDMLSERLHESYEKNRRKTILDLVSDLRAELDSRRDAIKKAKERYGKTLFTVERGFLTALTGVFQPETTEDDNDVDEKKKLAKEAKATVGAFEHDTDEDSKSLVVHSDNPVDAETIDLDYSILRAIKEHVSLNLMDLFGLMSERNERDNIGNWLDANRYLLNRFRDVIANPKDYFVILGIPPTSDVGRIKRAYRDIVRETHPDRTSHLQPQQKLEATERFMKATNAYTNLMSRAGKEKLDSFSPTYYLGRISQLFY